MANKRQIRGHQYDVAQLVDDALAYVDTINLNTERARELLILIGHKNPADELVTKYARESAMLDKLTKMTGAHFSGQIGKIDFSTREVAIDGVDAYLWRRVHGQRANWSKR